MVCLFDQRMRYLRYFVTVANRSVFTKTKEDTK